jgi:hypothetical protein
MSRKTKKGNYRVGYGKPPEHTRFKPGESGNPRGRPKGRPSFASAIEQALSESVVVVEHGRRKRLTKLAATARQLANKGAAGDFGAVRLIAAVMRIGQTRKERDTSETTTFTEADQHSQCERISGSGGTGKVRNDGRSLVEIMDEIYGLKNWRRERKPIVSAPVPQELDRCQGSEKMT